MVKKKLILKESELVELVTIISRTIQEQIPIEPHSDSGVIKTHQYRINQQKEKEKHAYETITKPNEEKVKLICDKILTGKDLTDDETEYLEFGGPWSGQIIKCLGENQPELNDAYGYHTVLMIIAVVLYVISAIGTIMAWTGIGAVIAKVALVLATIVEFADGLGYLLDDEPDYFMAGLTWVFMIVYPAAQAGKNVFKPITSKVSKIMSQAAKVGFKGVDAAFGKLTRAEKLIMRQLFKDYPKLKSGLSLATKKLNQEIKVVQELIKFLRGKPGMEWVVRQLNWIIKNILKRILVGLKLIANIIIMLSAWDPQLAAGGFTWLGQKTGWDTFGSLASLFDKWAKSGIHGQSAYKHLLDAYGTPRAVITTTPKDCSMETYSWLDTRIKYKKEFNENIDITKDSDELIDGIWEEWQKGWRPGIEKKDIDCIECLEFALFTYQTYYNLLDGNEKILYSLGFTEEDISAWWKPLESCEAFLRAIEKENEDLQDAMTYLDMFKKLGKIK